MSQTKPETAGCYWLYQAGLGNTAVFPARSANGMGTTTSTASSSFLTDADVVEIVQVECFNTLAGADILLTDSTGAQNGGLQWNVAPAATGQNVWTCGADAEWGGGLWLYGNARAHFGVKMSTAVSCDVCIYFRVWSRT